MDARKTLHSNRELIHNVLTETDDLMDILFSKGLISASVMTHHYEIQLSKDKIDDLLKLLLLAPELDMFEAFMDWLQTTNKELYEALNSAPPTDQTVEPLQAEADQDSDGESDSESLSSSATGVIKMTGRRPNMEFLSHLHPDDVYDLTEPSRGYALLFINDKIQDRKSTRRGSEYDEINLRKVLEWLGFTVLTYHNFTQADVMRKLAEHTHNPEHRKLGAFILAFLSDGDRSCVYSADNRPIYITELTDSLDSNNFPAMATKPKFIFIEASQGDKTDKGIVAKGQDTPLTTSTQKPIREISSKLGGVESRPRKTGVAPIVTQDVTSVACKADLVVCMAAFPSHKALHHAQLGSVVTRLLSEVLYKYSHCKDLLEILAKARRKLAGMDLIGTKQVITTMDTLTKQFYLYPPART